MTRGELIARYGQPERVRAELAVALLRLDQPKAADVLAFRYRDQEAADAWQAATLENHGVPALGTVAVDDGVVGAYDLRMSVLEAIRERAT